MIDLARSGIPIFGSPEHKEWLAERLSRNVAFRQMVLDSVRRYSPLMRIRKRAS